MFRVFRRPAGFAGAPPPIPAIAGFDNIIDLSAFREQVPVALAPRTGRAKASVVRLPNSVVSVRSDPVTKCPTIWDRARGLIDRMEAGAKERNELREERMRRRALERHKPNIPKRIADIRVL